MHAHHIRGIADGGAVGMVLKRSIPSFSKQNPYSDTSSARKTRAKIFPEKCSGQNPD
jgi:hypothetical protein